MTAREQMQRHQFSCAGTGKSAQCDARMWPCRFPLYRRAHRVDTGGTEHRRQRPGEPLSADVVRPESLPRLSRSRATAHSAPQPSRPLATRSDDQRAWIPRAHELTNQSNTNSASSVWVWRSEEMEIWTFFASIPPHVLSSIPTRGRWPIDAVPPSSGFGMKSSISP